VKKPPPDAFGPAPTVAPQALTDRSVPGGTASSSPPAETAADQARRVVAARAAGDSGAVREVLLDAQRRGRIIELGSLLDLEIPADPDLSFTGPDWIIRLFVLDASVRSHQVSRVELLHALEPTTAPDAPPEAAAWGRLLDAELQLWSVEAGGVWQAQLALNDIKHVPEDDDLWDMIVARLQRLTGLAQMLVASDADRTMSAFDESFRRLRRAGMVEEVAFTTSFALALKAMFSDGDDLPELIAESRRQAVLLSELGSDREAMGWTGLGWTAAQGWEVPVIEEAVEHLQTCDPMERQPAIAQVGALLPLVVELANKGASPALADLVVDTLHRLRRSTLPVSGAFIYFANMFADEADYDTADRLVSVLSQEEIGAGVQLGLLTEELDIRTKIARRELHGRKFPEAMVERWIGAGLPSRATVCARRFAKVFNDAGDAASAHHFRLLAQTLEAQGHAHTPWEVALEGARPRKTNRGEIRLLAPDGHAVVGGERVDLTPNQAKLLAALSTRGHPVTVDWLLEVMWPEVAPDVGRNRLRVLLHQLRRTLSIETDELLLRTRSGLELVADDRWIVDVTELQAALAPDSPEQVHAVLHSGIHLLDRQLAYDDAVTEMRDDLRQQWIRTALRLLDRGLLTGEQLTFRLVALDITDHHVLVAARTAVRAGAARTGAASTR